MRSGEMGPIGTLTTHVEYISAPASLENNIEEEEYEIFTIHEWGESTPDICHGLTDGVRGEKIFHVEKFQISVHDRCGEI